MASNNSINKSMPLPCFMVRPSASAVSVTGDGTSYFPTFDEIIFDNTSSFDTSVGNYKFIVPKAGFYLFSYSLYITSISAAMTKSLATILTDPGALYFGVINPAIAKDSSNNLILHDSAIISLNVGQAIQVRINLFNGLKDAGIATTSAADPLTYFSGYFIR